MNDIRDRREPQGTSDASVPENELGELRALEEALGELPTEAELPRDLWPDIRARLEGGSGDVVELTAWKAGSARRFSLSLTQLVAAGIVLAMVSGGSVWLALSSGSETVAQAPAPVLGAPGDVVAVSGQGGVAATTLQDYENAVAELELILEEGRQVLGHETIQVIEESLDVIDRAIDEAREALADDPGSEVLNGLLTRNMLKKMDILRQTAVVIRARST